MIVPPSFRRAPTRALRLTLTLGLCAWVTACADTRDAEAEAAERARQMRDVSRMLDAMETPPTHGVAHAQAVSRLRATSEPPPPPNPWWHGPWVAWVGGGMAAALMLVAIALLHLRRRHRLENTHVSIASSFDEVAIALREGPISPADPDISPRQSSDADDMPPPEWTYQRSAYETQSLQLMLEPVDLMPPRATPGIATSVLVTRLHAPDIAPALFLSGRHDFPVLRHVGNDEGDFDAWEAILRDSTHAAGIDGHLARWLLPALLCQRAAFSPASVANRLLAEAVSLTHAACHAASTNEQPWWRAQTLRVELARVSRLGGATRLLALRDLGSDAADTHPAPLNAWIDVHLAWASWLKGAAAHARLDTADAACQRLASIDAPLASRRYADLYMRRAQLVRGDERIHHLDEARRHLHHVASTAHPDVQLRLAECLHQRATLLTRDVAMDTCSLALAHAFAAGEHPAWRIASLEQRLAIQLTHGALTGDDTAADIAHALRRELAHARSLLRPGTA